MTSALKLTVLYGHPTDPAAFEAYYNGTHLPMAAAAPGLGRIEISMGLNLPDGSAPSFYRVFEAWFDSPAHLAQVISTPEWKRVTDDLPNFASGGATVILSQLQ